MGKGKNLRVLQHERDAIGEAKSYKLNIIRKIKQLGLKIDYRIEAFFDSEAECLDREMADIGRIGRHDLGTGPLANLTDGGEGTSGLSEETRQRIDLNLHTADAPGDRGIANRFFFELCDEVRSVPVRPASEFRPEKIRVQAQPRQPTLRMAAALAASAISNRVLLEIGASVPRSFHVEEKLMYIENGVAGDILKSGMAHLDDAKRAGEESFLLTELGVKTIEDHISESLLLDAGVWMPQW